MEVKVNKYILVSLKVLVFISFMYTAAIMFKLRNITTAILIIFAVSLFLIFNKLESMERRLKLLEG